MSMNHISNEPEVGAAIGFTPASIVPSSGKATVSTYNLAKITGAKIDGETSPNTQAFANAASPYQAPQITPTPALNLSLTPSV